MSGRFACPAGSLINHVSRSYWRDKVDVSVMLNLGLRGEELGLSADSYNDHFYNSVLELRLQPQEEYAWDFSVSSVSPSRFSGIRQGLQATT